MKTRPMPVLGTLPTEVSRVLGVVAAQDHYRDDRPLLARLFGAPRFEWQVGWLTADRRQHAFARISGWPPALITEAITHLRGRFVVARAEMGLLDTRRHHPFAIVLISDRKADPQL